MSDDNRMNRNENQQLLDLYPVYVINKATRALGELATFTEIKAECERLHLQDGRKGKTFIEEVASRF